MRKFIVNVNGASYEVEVEEISGAQSAVPAVQAAPAAKAEPAPAPKAAPVPAPAAQGGEIVSAPMPGNILDVKVQAGDIVKSGDVLLILEAMKMENEILAPKDGKVLSVSATKGVTVNAGDTLCTID